MTGFPDEINASKVHQYTEAAEFTLTEWPSRFLKKKSGLAGKVTYPLQKKC
jgi:hypothetical protein